MFGSMGNIYQITCSEVDITLHDKWWLSLPMLCIFTILFSIGFITSVFEESMELNTDGIKAISLLILFPAITLLFPILFIPIFKFFQFLSNYIREFYLVSITSFALISIFHYFVYKNLLVLVVSVLFSVPSFLYIYYIYDEINLISLLMKIAITNLNHSIYTIWKNLILPILLSLLFVVLWVITKLIIV